MTGKSKKPAASRSSKRRKPAPAERDPETWDFRKPAVWEIAVHGVRIPLRYHPPVATRRPGNEDSIQLNIETARRGLSRARRVLRTDENLAMACDEILGAMCWAAEAWLRRRLGRRPQGASWAAMWLVFDETAPKRLRGRVSSVVSAVHALEWDLIGAPPDWEFGGSTWRPKDWTIEGWKEKVHKEMDRAVELVDEIERYAAPRKQRRGGP